MSRKRLLLIDDEEDIREVAALALETMDGFEVMTAESGPAGIARAEQGRPDAILLDYMMPGMDGPATFARLQESEATRNIPVIFLTARVLPADRKRMTELGGVAILSKPFDPLLLGAEISSLLEAHKEK